MNKKVYKISWSIPAHAPHLHMISNVPHREMFKVLGTEEKAKDLYGNLNNAALLIGIDINLRIETMDVD